MDADRLRALLSAGRALASELDGEAVLRQLLDCARDMTGARYAAIGVLDERGTGLERFITSGVDAETHRAIGDLPRGRGVLGLLISDPQSLRLHDVAEHPRSSGFPAAHPAMRTFLGVPILVRGEAWGNLYLTEKADGDFNADDEEVAVVLSDWAAVALANARLYRAESDRRAQLERSNRALETTTEVARALSGVTDVERVLELVVERSRALLNARAVEIALLEGDELVIAAIAGEGTDGLLGARLPARGLLGEAAMRADRTQRFEDVPQGSLAHRELGARRALATPIIHRGRTLGFLLVLDRLRGDRPFTDEEQRLVEAFTESAATAVASAQTATDRGLRLSIAASEAERRRWARELHDETLQELAGIRVLLAGARRSRDPSLWRTAIDDSVELIGGGIHNLRALITDLRPAALDEFGVDAALEALTSRVARQHGLRVNLEMDLSFRHDAERGRLPEEIDATIYRLVQEALTNVVKHAGARRVLVTLTEDADHVEILIRDDGSGFDPATAEAGYGLLGMRERVALARADLEIDSTPGAGTTVRARIPIPAEQQLVTGSQAQP
ncbi:MAG: GAF domain-containing protein [Solirubrobacteraceae bacterium]